MIFEARHFPILSAMTRYQILQSEGEGQACLHKSLSPMKGEKLSRVLTQEEN
jgi:hypothetical protein